MVQFIQATSRFLLRHWGKLLLLVLIGSGAAAIRGQPQLRVHAVTLSNRVLEWAGLTEHVGRSAHRPRASARS